MRSVTGPARLLAHKVGILINPELRDPGDQAPEVEATQVAPDDDLGDPGQLVPLDDEPGAER